MGSDGSLPHPNEPPRQEAQRLAFCLSRKQNKNKQAWMAYTMPPLLSTNVAPQDALSSSSHEIDLRSSGQEFQSSDLSRVSSYSIPGLYPSTDDASSVLDAWGWKTKTVIGNRCVDDVQRTRRHDDDTLHGLFTRDVSTARRLCGSVGYLYGCRPGTCVRGSGPADYLRLPFIGYRGQSDQFHGVLDMRERFQLSTVLNADSRLHGGRLDQSIRECCD